MKNKTKIIAGVVILVVLAAAFWYGGGAPGLHGWKVSEPGTAAESVDPQVDSGAAAEEEPEQSEVPEDEPVLTEGSEETSEVSEILPEENAEKPEAQPPAAEPEKPEQTTGPETMDINPATGKDQYNTDPVPEGKPAPVEPQDATITDVAHTCTISIRCDTILDHLDWLDPEKVELVPDDGVILAPVSVTFYEGESVFNVLQRVCKQNAIHMEFENTPMYNSAYIEGIHNLYEFDCGELSGWMYSVNGWFPNYGCSRYALQAGDVIAWVYTCDLGYDVGGGYAVGN